MSMSSYDDLIKQVESLKVENTHLRRELQDNSSNLTVLENEASNMKDVLSHLQTAMHDDLGDNCTTTGDMEIPYSDENNTENKTTQNSTDNLDQNSNSSNGEEETKIDQNWVPQDDNHIEKADNSQKECNDERDKQFEDVVDGGGGQKVQQSGSPTTESPSKKKKVPTATLR